MQICRIGRSAPRAIGGERSDGALADGGFGSPADRAGMLEKHYSPRAMLTLYEGDAHAAPSVLVEAAAAALAGGNRRRHRGRRDRPALLGWNRRAGVRSLPWISGRTRRRRVEALHDVRELDGAGADVILVRGFPDHGLGAAVQDRLRRAAAGRIVRVMISAMGQRRRA